MGLATRQPLSEHQDREHEPKDCGGERPRPVRPQAIGQSDPPSFEAPGSGTLPAGAVRCHDAHMTTERKHESGIGPPAPAYSTTVMLSMTTCSAGTSACAPREPVGTRAMMSTVSMPPVTLPNTA